MSVYYGKTSDSIEMPFGVVGRVDQRNNELDGGSSPRKGATFGENGWRKVMYRRRGLFQITLRFLVTVSANILSASYNHHPVITIL